MRDCLPTVHRFWLYLGLGIILATPADGWTQQLGGTKESLYKAFRENSKRRDKLFSGEEPATADDKSALKIAEAAANWYIYRLTHVTENPLDVQKEFSSEVEKMMGKTFDKKVKNNREFINMFGPALVSSMKEVLARDVKKNQATVINAATMLPTMAKLKQDTVSDYLIELVNDSNTHDVVRLYALKGLKEAMPITIQPGDDLDLTDAAQNLKRSRDVKLVTALTKYIEGIERSASEAGMSAEELDAVRYIRREAIISLAHAGAPAVLAVPMKVGKKPAPDGMVAPTLLKVLAGSLKPPPSLQEKIEAALGLCAMKHPNMPEYDPSVATYLIGQTIVEFVDHYNKDWENIAAIGAGRRIPSIAYRTEAKRLRDGLADFAKNGNLKSKELKEVAYPILDSMTPSATTYPRIDNPKVLHQYLQQLQQTRPKTGEVFKTLKAPLFSPK
jgi:hypothetical protein